MQPIDLLHYSRPHIKGQSSILMNFCYKPQESVSTLLFQLYQVNRTFIHQLIVLLIVCNPSHQPQFIDGLGECLVRIVDTV